MVRVVYRPEGPFFNGLQTEMILVCGRGSKLDPGGETANEKWYQVHQKLTLDKAGRREYC